MACALGDEGVMGTEHTEQDDNTDDVKQNDPFDSHFKYEMSKDYASNFRELGYTETELKWSALAKLTVKWPAANSDNSSASLTKKTELSDFSLKENLMRSCKTSKIFKEPEKLSPLQSEIFSIISSYKDFHYMAQTHENCEEVRLIYCMHALNHILKLRGKISHHDSKLAKNPNEEYRDQGFTRPTVLIIAPFKDSCLKIVNILSSLVPDYNIMNKNRFLEKFGSEEKPAKRKRKRTDYEATFVGNTDEDFKIGIKIKNKVMKLYTNFYASDMIIASPLALRTIIGAEGDKKRDFDFLSSIEIFILDKADILLMQNWTHVIHLAKHLNLVPKEPHGCNFFRVRFYALEGWSKFYRQTLVFSAIDNGFHRALFGNYCFNHEGYVFAMEDVTSPTVCQVMTSMPQVFHRFESDDPVTDPDKRFEFFTSKILPNFKWSHMSRTMIYIQTYFDFVRLRNYFRRNEISAAMLCEYTDPGKIAQGRNLFFKGDRHFMLYTERLHFYQRYDIKGVENVIFYQLPTYPSFYYEICNFVLDADPARRAVAAPSCTILFSKSDCRQMKHIVGFSRTCHMYNSSQDVFMLRTE